jgi:hypothetical protein
VDKPRPETDASERNAAQEAGGKLVISGGDSPLLLEMANEALKPRHGVPVRQIQSMPSSLWRWFLGGRPPREEGVVRKGAKIAHSLSLISPRITVGLEFAKRPVRDHSKSVS